MCHDKELKVCGTLWSIIILKLILMLSGGY